MRLYVTAKQRDVAELLTINRAFQPCAAHILPVKDLVNRKRTID